MKSHRVVLFVITGLYGGLVFAGGAGGGLAWEAPLVTIANSFTGPVAFAASTIAFVASLATLAFADNLSGAGRQLVYLVLIIAALIGVVNLLSTLFGAGSTLTASVSLMLWVAAIAMIVVSVTLAMLEIQVARALKRRVVRSWSSE